MSPKLTTRLLESPNTQGLYHAATTAHPFLVAAANGTLSHPLLEFYLAQDKVYAGYAYPKFIGGLFRRIDAYRNASQPGQPQSLLPVLAASITGVAREVKFFDSLAAQYGLNLQDSTSESPPHTKRAATLNYVAEMAYVAEWSETWEEGIVFLWAMEKVYLDAWTRVYASLSGVADNHSQNVQALKTLSANWSSDAFTTFVDDIGKLVDEISTPELDAKAEGIWRRVLELEIAFWPLETELEAEA
ncbi:Thiaminase-2/PQQC domain-containing protein [Pleurotus pulmonarius]